MADTQTTTQTNNDNGLSNGQIALIIIGCVLIIGVVIALIAALTRKKNKNKASSKQNLVQIGEPTPQQNPQLNQQVTAANQPAAPTEQNNPQKNQNGQVLSNDLSNNLQINQKMMSDFIDLATPKIMQALDKYDQQNDQQNDIHAQDGTISEKKENPNTDEDTLQEPQTIEEEPEEPGDQKPEKEQNEMQKVEQSVVDEVSPDLSADTSTDQVTDRDPNTPISENDTKLKFPVDFTYTSGDVEKLVEAGRLKNPFEQVPMEKEIDNINWLKEQRKKEKEQNNGNDNNIPFSPMTVPNQPEQPQNNAGNTIDLGTLLGITPMQKQPVNEPKTIPEQKNNDTIIGQEAAPKIGFGNQNGFMANNAPEKPSIFFGPKPIDNNQQMNENNEMQNNTITFGAPRQPMTTTSMPLPITQPKQRDDIALDDNEPMPPFNIVPEQSAPEQSAPGNNTPVNVPPLIMPSPIKMNSVNNNNNTLNENMMPPMEVIGKPDTVPNKPEMSGSKMFNKPNFLQEPMPKNDFSNKPAMPNNSMFNQLQPINENEIKPDAPAFMPPMMKMEDKNENKMPEMMNIPFMMQPPKTGPEKAEFPALRQMNGQNKEQDKNDNKVNEGMAFNPFMQPTVQMPSVPMKKENNSPMFSVLPGLGGKPMEQTNNNQSKNNLETQNKCTCTLCTGGNK